MDNEINIIPSGCLAGRAVIETHDHGGVSNDDHNFSLPRREAPELCMNLVPLSTEGAGKAGCPMHPQPRVRNKTKHTSVVTTGLPGHPAFPAQWFYGLLRALPGVRILGCHRHWRIKVCQSPVGMTRLRKFSTSNGCQDHTTSPYASAPFVWSWPPLLVLNLRRRVIPTGL